MVLVAVPKIDFFHEKPAASRLRVFILLNDYLAFDLAGQC